MRSVSLKPEVYRRNRFAEGDQSYEKKKHGAQKLTIRAPELRQMMGAFNHEVAICHTLILEHDLMPELVRARNANGNQG